MKLSMKCVPIGGTVVPYYYLAGQTPILVTVCANPGTLYWLESVLTLLDRNDQGVVSLGSSKLVYGYGPKGTNYPSVLLAADYYMIHSYEETNLLHTPVEIGKVEKPCKGCKRPNFMDAKSCWCCGASDPWGREAIKKFYET